MPPGVAVTEIRISHHEAPVGWRAPIAWTAPLGERIGDHLPWIVPFWMAGVLALYARVLGGWMAARRLRKAGARRAPQAWQERLSRLAARLRVSKPVALLESWLVEGPVVIGFLRPVILVPASALTGLAPEQLEALLVHELAHIRRYDYLVNLVQSLVEGLLFYHPAVWWVSGMVRAEREKCCDDAAVVLCGDAPGYAAALAALEQRRWAAGQTALAAWQPQEPPAPPALPEPPAAAAPSPPAAPPATAAPPVLPAAPAQPRHGDGFAVFSGDDTYMSGWFSDFDTEQARRFGKAKEFIWLRRGGQTYVVRDAETVQRARELFPEARARTEEVAALQAQLLEQQVRLRGSTTELSAVRDRLKASLERLQERSLTRDELGELQAELMQLEIRLDERRARVDEMQARIAAERQRAEVESQLRSSERVRRTWQLLEETVAKGLAERIPER